MTTTLGRQIAAAGTALAIGPRRVIAMVQGEAGLATEQTLLHGLGSNRVLDVQEQLTEMRRGVWTVPLGESRAAQAELSRMREEVTAAGASLVRLPEEDPRKIEVDAPTSMPIRRATTIQLRATATMPGGAARETAADLTDFRAAAIAQHRSPIAQVQVRNPAVIVTAGSASLPAANARMTALRHAEAIIAAGLRWS